MPIVPLAADHAVDAARLHIDGQPGTFLTRLGPAVLTVLYRALPQSPVGFGFVDLTPGPSPRAERGASSNSGCSDSLQPPDDQLPVTNYQLPITGFISATTSIGRLFAEMGTRRLPQFLPPLVTRFVREPGLLLLSAQTVLYPFFAAGDAADDASKSRGKSAELLSIMVEPGQRGRGTGTALLHALVDECRQRDIDVLDVTVDAGNAGARRFYERHGFAYDREFTLYGRAMCLYKRQMEQGDSNRG